jgi:predicted negative regulator of RcsB-dependent stress response
VFGFWFYNRSAVLKAESADRKLPCRQAVARQRATSRSAQSDLKKIADQYPSTERRRGGGMLLAQVKLEQGDAQGAVTTLKELWRTRTPRARMPTPVRSSPRAMPYSQFGKYAEAAGEYERAAC